MNADSAIIENALSPHKTITLIIPKKIEKMEEKVPYFPTAKTKKHKYSEVVKCLDSLGYIIQVNEKEYYELKTIKKIPALCPLNHGLCYISISKLKRGDSCCKKCGFEKRKKTCLTKYGVENPAQNKEIREKMKQTNLKLYGVEYAVQNEIIQEKIKQTNMERYGVEFPLQIEEVQEKRKQTNMERYGVEFPLQNEQVREKGKQTNLERYGVENPSQNEQVKEKKRETTLKNHGVENPTQNETIQEKIKQTNLERYGVKCALQNVEIQEKIKQTNLERYGVEYPMQNPEICEKQQKSCYSKKEYIFPSGKETLVQGYEGFCLDDLLNNENIQEDEIFNLPTQMPVIWYELENETKRYYPDIYIPSKNLIIEVKSEYTFNVEKEKVIAKALATVKMGFQYEFRIYGKKGELISRIPIEEKDFLLEN